jgi:ATP-dependent helicase/nuclease subunit A
MPWLPYAVRQHGGVQGETTGKNKLFAWHIHSEDDPVFRSPKPETAAPAAEDSSPDAVARIEDLRARLQWQYPFVKATQRIAKASVSELRRRALEETDEEARWLFRHRSRLLSGSFRRDVADAAALSPAEVGAAHHRFLQRLDLERAGDAAALAAEAQRLAREGHLSAAEAAALDLEAVAAFWNSEQGRRIRAVPQRVRRELAFTARFAPEELDGLLGLAARGAPGGEEGEFVVVQGVADLVVVQPGELWLVDFKTDAVTPQTLEETARRYLPQMRLYARALERIYRRPVRECALHFLALRQSVPVAPG